MSDEARAMLDAARKLPPEAQVRLAETLLDGAEGGEPESEEELVAELHRC